MSLINMLHEIVLFMCENIGDCNKCANLKGCYRYSAKLQGKVGA